MCEASTRKQSQRMSAFNLCILYRPTQIDGHISVCNLSEPRPTTNEGGNILANENAPLANQHLSTQDVVVASPQGVEETRKYNSKLFTRKGDSSILIWPESVQLLVHLPPDRHVALMLLCIGRVPKNN